MKPSILITRPRDQAARIAKYLEDNGFDVFIEPIFQIVQNDLHPENLVKNLANKKIAALILTSGNAAEVAFALRNNLALKNDIKIYAVGKKTAQIFVDAGFSNIVISQKNSAQDLKNLILHDQDSQKNEGIILYFCGEIVTLDFEIELEKYGYDVEKIISYQVVEEDNFSAEFFQHTQKTTFDFVLLYSKNSAHHFCKLVKKHNLLEYFRLAKILCLSENILAVLRKSGFENSATFDAIPSLKKFYD